MTTRRLLTALVLFAVATSFTQALDKPAQRSNVSEAAQAIISAALGRKDSAYRVWEQARDLRAENQQQKFATDFTADSVTVRSGAALCRMTLRSFGYGEALAAVSPAAPQSSLNRVEYRRGQLTEWYVNGPLGLEQGFTLEQPTENANGRPLAIALSLSGNLTPAVDEKRTGLSLKTPDGRSALRYSGLSATDASGKELTSWLELQGTQLLLRVDVAGARYPVVVDPIVQQAELTASDPSDLATLGISVAISGNTVVAGAPGFGGGFGSAYVFVKPSTGWANMTETAELSASDGDGHNEFGYAVAADGNTVVVTGLQNAHGKGAAYVFVKPASGWTNMTQSAELNNSDSAPDDFFGGSVSMSGTTVAVGAMFANSNGAVYVFTPPAARGSFTETAKLTASDGAAGNDLGISVGISGNTIVAGSIGGNGGAGAAYVFVEPAGGWISATQTAELTASDGVQYDGLGSSVGIGGLTGTDTIVAGAPAHGFGAAYVFVQPSGGWANGTQTAELTSATPAVRTLGNSVAISGNNILAGAPGTKSSKGAVLAFTKPAGGWVNMTQSALLLATDGSGGDRFGYSVGLSGNVAAIGAPNFGNAGSQIGAAYVFAP